jgi:hypothetical protein
MLFVKMRESKMQTDIYDEYNKNALELKEMEKWTNDYKVLRAKQHMLKLEILKTIEGRLFLLEHRVEELEWGQDSLNQDVDYLKENLP